MLIPLLIDVSTNGVLATSFLVSAATLLGLALLLQLSFGKPMPLTHSVDRQLFVGLTWIIVSLSAVLPLLLSQSLTPVAALFEMTSAITTTGATFFSHGSATTMPVSLKFWIAELQWFGGLMTLASISLLFNHAAHAKQAKSAGTISNPSSDLRPSQSGFFNGTKTIISLYAGLTAIAALALIFAGLPVFDATILAMTSISTGGWTPEPQGLIIYESRLVLPIICLIMILGATSVLWTGNYGQMKVRKISHFREEIAFLTIVIIFAGFSIIQRAASGFDLSSPEPDTLPTLFRTIFTAISIVSTTGFEYRAGDIGVISLPALMTVILIGGGWFSTAGGIKVVRLRSISSFVYAETRKLLYPNSVDKQSEQGNHRQGLNWLYFILSVGIIGAGALLLSLETVAFEKALLASVTSYSNIGPAYMSYAASQGAAESPYTLFSDPALFVMIILMICGRLGIIVTAVVLISLIRNIQSSLGEQLKQTPK